MKKLSFDLWLSEVRAPKVILVSPDVWIDYCDDLAILTDPHRFRASNPSPPVYEVIVDASLPDDTFSFPNSLVYNWHTRLAIPTSRSNEIPPYVLLKTIELYPGTTLKVWETGSINLEDKTTHRYVDMLFEEGNIRQHERFEVNSQTKTNTIMTNKNLKIGTAILFFFAQQQDHLNNSAVIAHAIVTRPWNPGNGEPNSAMNILVFPDNGSVPLSKSSCPRAKSLSDALGGNGSIVSGTWCTVEDAESWGIDLTNGLSFSRKDLLELASAKTETSGPAQADQPAE